MGIGAKEILEDTPDKPDALPYGLIEMEIEIENCNRVQEMYLQASELAANSS